MLSYCKQLQLPDEQASPNAVTASSRHFTRAFSPRRGTNLETGVDRPPSGDRHSQPLDSMDSYNTYRDRDRDGSGRSPDRDWGRDDRKSDRGDSFFRGRSPGAS